jgi:hypothetical protein
VGTFCRKKSAGGVKQSRLVGIVFFAVLAALLYQPFFSYPEISF